MRPRIHAASCPESLPEHTRRRHPSMSGWVIVHLSKRKHLRPCWEFLQRTRDPLQLRVIAGAHDNIHTVTLGAHTFFGDDDVLYLMEDMATGEIRLSILWEWVHKGARLTAGDPTAGVNEGDAFTLELCRRLITEEYEKLQRADNRDVHDDSKPTTLPIAREIVERYVTESVKPPWYVDLLNITLGVRDVTTARERIARYVEAFEADGSRITQNLDFA